MSASERTAQAAGGCPFHAAGGPAAGEPAAGSPAAMAEAFDPFDGPYQLDPAEALRWSRDQLPVFYSPKLGYWVVSRYDDVKAVFRDAILFSPRNVLEPITPPCAEAREVLTRYGYAMNRTLVNEDEPAHMERRRVLSEHFLPANVEAHQAMIRRLTREKVDRFIDEGRIDLVDAMLYEIPLTVALHFLGVPEDELERLRRFSVAHAVNAFGRPTPAHQIDVAHAVGRFWQYAGGVIETMRADPDGTGWMHHTIRKNAELPAIVTDSYVHSMMMAIIVAAHETTALASAGMFKTLLTHRDAWEAICADPALIPNAVEESLRVAGSAAAWRRQTTAPTRLGGIDLPEGAKLLIVQASANQDERHFEHAEQFDIYRDNAVDHLTFGYGSHQCMGKNIGRMEMRIFLEEVSRRLPHLRLADQTFTYLPNTTFRGPEAVWVEWDPARNPERSDPQVRTASVDFAVGAPARRDIARSVRVARIVREADDVLGLTLVDARGRALPRWSAGAHVELCLGGYDRKYSLCGAPDAACYQVAILHQADGRGGSRHIHETVREGMELKLRGPHNLFRLDEGAPAYLLVAGGIGITPILAMADRLKALGRPYAIHYLGRARSSMAFLDRLEADHRGRLAVHARQDGARADLPAIVAGLPPGAQVYACGPDRMLAALEELTVGHPDGTLHVERFAGATGILDPSKETAFAVVLKDSGLTLTVAQDQTLLDAIQAAGIDLACDCREGLCGSCEVELVAGEVDHRDRVLSRAERAEGRRMMACCSRSRDGGPLTLAL
ncbi:cytochrome P450/oxidoreductase [Methylobacterium nonmethylotrophicum]|uniref:Cytochrome P450 n=1 Tax=Methylobacterium nonmethylotrophicum TaxID=1141884 RepID=A0A4Z0NKC3_9HYPH|nr:cytochrome P450/oxidoreductase [Methylobacterium nonmethylotrophicum]TGD96804.1 cytochrome P450 [Methylobacterium nonmethylotrophicum]